MKIELHEISIGDISKKYVNNEEDGVYGYDGKLNIRPIYQREFIYDTKKRDAVIDTVRKNFPLNVMYWCKNEDGSYEVLDGQQRTISICEYVAGAYSINYMYFHNLKKEEQDQIINYKLMIYICEGSEVEKLDWFKTINIAGERLTDQELRNAIYTGSWLTDAKRYFSKSNCAAYQLGKDFLNGTAIRQDYLEAVLNWIGNGKIEEYMSIHQHDKNASELWSYFQKVIAWVKITFPTYYKEMKGLQWGLLYNEFKDELYNVADMEKEVKQLMADEDITKASGIFEYLLNKKNCKFEKMLNIRGFDKRMKRTAYQKQKGVCAHCGKHFELDEMEADHITPWHLGGKTIAENCQMLCRDCNRTKSGK